MVTDGIHQEHLPMGGRSAGSGGNNRMEMNWRSLLTMSLKESFGSLTADYGNRKDTEKYMNSAMSLSVGQLSLVKSQALLFLSQMKLSQSSAKFEMLVKLSVSDHE